MKEEKIIATAVKLTRIRETREAELMRNVMRISSLVRLKKYKCENTEIDTDKKIKIILDKSAIIDKDSAYELEKIYGEDPYVFLWAAGRSMTMGKTYFSEPLSKNESLYIETFFTLLSSARNLKYENIEQENSKKSVSLEIANYEDLSNYTYLTRSIAIEHNELTIRLINFGMDINRESEKPGFTPLMIAVQRKNLSAVKYLVGSGAKLRVKDSNGNSVLHLALMCFFDRVYEGKTASNPCKIEIEIIKLLLRHDYGVTPNKEGKTAYDIAKEMGITEIIEIIEAKCPFFRMEIKELNDIPNKPTENLTSFIRGTKEPSFLKL